MFCQYVGSQPAGAKSLSRCLCCSPVIKPHFTEPQNSWGWQGPPDPQSIPCSSRDTPSRVPRPTSRWLLDISRRRPDSLWVPVPELHHPNSTDVLPHAQMEPPVFQLVPSASGPGTGHLWKKNWIHPLCSLPSGIDGHWWDAQASAQLSASQEELLQAPQYLGLSSMSKFPLYSEAKNRTEVQVWPHQCCADGKDHQPRPVGSTFCNSRPDTVNILSNKGKCWLLFNLLHPSASQGLPCRAASRRVPPAVLLPGVVPPQGQDSELGLWDKRPPTGTELNRSISTSNFPLFFQRPHLVIMWCCHMAFLFGYTMAKPSVNRYVWSLPVALSPTAEHALKHASTGRQNFFQCFDNFIFY